MSVKKGEEMDSASCTMHGDLVFPGIDTNKAERWYALFYVKVLYTIFCNKMIKSSSGVLYYNT